ncbi:helix-turn-helix domain-containing protein [Hymenobacter sp. BT683]|uniref:Helix-turn-helix domain-containing protein n=1 Tax=Hymenobacter jeongseonensis TaxID=2791027 RepID=A0ABS0IJB8_9BACT|nr:AraC family transcriptional regulator [Hymenobacter jeongseonensis]MBF9238114.1 helix-turn-helix domain-containing protein [Hymenobacter jeongseonensis]
MHVDVSFMAMALFAVIAQALFAAGLLAAAPVNRVSNRFLALLMGAIALWVLDGFFRVSGLYGQNAGLYFSPIYYSLAFGPLLYFYVRSLVNSGFRWRARYWWHFGPVLAQAGLYWWLRFQPYAVRFAFWEQVHQPLTYRLEFIGTWVSLMAYLFLSLRLLRGYGRWLEDNFSEVSRLRLRWLRWLLVLLAVVSGQWLVELVLREFFGVYYRYDFSTELLGVVVFVIGIVGLRQADMRAVHFAPEAEQLEAESSESVPALSNAVPNPTWVAAPAATESSATPATLETPLQQHAATAELPIAVLTPPDPLVMERIRRALVDDGLYQNPTLTLAQLSAHTGLAPRLISFTVNAGFGRSFNDLVNGYRVAEVQRRLAAPDARRYTLLGIAFESGFNSKTTFNRIFKQVTGVAPREYHA